jgi:general secretion pathway protein I
MSKNKKIKKHLHGFTLIECLVALFIIALVLASAARSIGMAITDVEDSTSREVANWIVNNQYASYKIDGVYPNIGNDKKTVEMAGRSFIVNSNVSATPNPFFRKIDIAVSMKDHPDHVLFRTINFMSQY